MQLSVFTTKCIAFDSQISESVPTGENGESQAGRAAGTFVRCTSPSPSLLAPTLGSFVKTATSDWAKLQFLLDARPLVPRGLTLAGDRSRDVQQSMFLSSERHTPWRIHELKLIKSLQNQI